MEEWHVNAWKYTKSSLGVKRLTVRRAWNFCDQILFCCSYSSSPTFASDFLYTTYLLEMLCIRNRGETLRFLLLSPYHKNRYEPCDKLRSARLTNHASLPSRVGMVEEKG